MEWTAKAHQDPGAIQEDAELEGVGKILAGGRDGVALWLLASLLAAAVAVAVVDFG
jgi:hypothetical protein